MGKRIVIVQGHPDPAGGHLCHGLADAYADGARTAGLEVRRIEVARLDFPWVKSQAEFTGDDVPSAIAEAQDELRWADHVVLVFPLWLGTLPALLKAFLEQVLRPGYAFESSPKGWPRKLLAGRSARVVVTMGMPAIIYRWFYGARGVLGVKRNILAFCGFRPVRVDYLGMVEGAGDARRARWLAAMGELGRNGR